MDITSFSKRSVKNVIKVCYGQQGKEFCIQQPPINVAKCGIYFSLIYFALNFLHGCIPLQTVRVIPSEFTPDQIYFPVIGVCVAAVATTVIFGIQIQSESLVFISSVGINVKMKNWFGQVTAEFFEIGEIKDIVILEAITMQRVVCYLAVLLEGSESSKEQLYPLFMKSSPDLESLKVIYKDVHQLLKESTGS
ncbi:phosphatidylinositol N-acetylglucosaminyltransferase subunit H-like [Ylistrum balloti]|uniref:phosphatidylinositol N-acetylglucosaminyltransferase subunit H-like n=1 Tax=Ylistrum balloti TaxID=509963 RepID=UPI002905D770|nr:phosphatidylinositol N-acetylglucosaminyltransferase subunit H-like [Ylistrum balloti]